MKGRQLSYVEKDLRPKMKKKLETKDTSKNNVVYNLNQLSVSQVQCRTFTKLILPEIGGCTTWCNVCQQELPITNVIACAARNSKAVTLQNKVAQRVVPYSWCPVPLTLTEKLAIQANYRENLKVLGAGLGFVIGTALAVTKMENDKRIQLYQIDQEIALKREKETLDLILEFESIRLRLRAECQRQSGRPPEVDVVNLYLAIKNQQYSYDPTKNIFKFSIFHFFENAFIFVIAICFGIIVSLLFYGIIYEFTKIFN